MIDRMIDSVLRPESTGDLLTARFREMFGTEMRIFRAPGRVNLIGEHTDYNDGFVMPAAIGFYTWVAAAKREDRVLEVYSDRFDEKVTFSLDALEGPVALTDCAAGHGNCEIEENCKVGRVWQRLNLAIRRALYDVTLAQLAGLDAPPARFPTLEREMKGATRSPARP